jgi:hypothetical protein
MGCGSVKTFRLLYCVADSVLEVEGYVDGSEGQ